jgi:hypothetical protein
MTAASRSTRGAHSKKHTQRGGGSRGGSPLLRLWLMRYGLCVMRYGLPITHYPLPAEYQNQNRAPIRCAPDAC